jgi:P27 family predicted phage terminase small subunit
MKGRRPKSTYLRLLEGNPGEHKIIPDIVVDGELGPCPAWFAADQVLKWDHLQRFAPHGMLTELDRQLVIQYCVAAAIYDKAVQDMAQHGAVVLSPNKGVPMQSPYLHTMNQAATQLDRCYDKLGFSPQSRTRVKAPHGRKAGKSSSTFANLKKFEIENKRTR